MFSSWKRSQRRIEADPVAEARLDESLNGVGQQFVAQSVKRLPLDDVNLSWRSDLNARLREEQSRLIRVRRRNLVLRPIAGLAVASAFAFALIVPPVEHPLGTSEGKVEANVMHAHLIAESNYHLTGSAVVAPETDSGAVGNATYEWEEVDLGAL